MQQNRNSEHATKAEAALSRGKVFEAERLALKALTLARQNDDFEGLAKVIPTLVEARRQRFRQALDIGSITFIDEPVTEDARFDAGCYLVRPPQVGADARRLRIAAFEQDTPVAVLCHEPMAIVQLLPIVAICPGLTLRTKVRPPKNLDKRGGWQGAPDMTWFTSAMDALGDFGIESLDPRMTPLRRLDALLEHLDALPEHEGLHRALQQACVDAAKAAAEEAETRARRSDEAATRKAAQSAPSSKELDDVDDSE